MNYLDWEDESLESAKQYCANCNHVEMCRWYPYEGCEFIDPGTKDVHSTIKRYDAKTLTDILLDECDDVTYFRIIKRLALVPTATQSNDSNELGALNSTVHSKRGEANEC